MMSRMAVAALLVLSTLLLSSCGDPDGPGAGPGDTEPPTITARSVSEGETGVGLIERIDVTFSEDMDPATISDTTLYISGRAPRGFVEYDPQARTASIVPDTLRAAEAPHILVVTDDVTDEAGNALAAPDTTGFETGPFDCEHLRDYLDPNETTATAAEVETDRLYRTLAVCGEDHDVYAFTLTEPRKVTVRTRIAHADTAAHVGWQIHLIREDGEDYVTHGTSAVPGCAPGYPFTFLPGTYYADIFSYDEPEYVLYDLEIVSSAPCDDDAYEDNDFRDEAAPVNEGVLEDLTGCIYDQDFFAIQVQAGETLTATVTVDPFHGYEFSRLIILTPSGAWAAWNEVTGAVNIADTVVGQTGTYYVSVRFWSDAVSYSLEIERS